MSTPDFYIGWQPKAPQKFAKQTRKAIVVLIILVILAAVVLGLQQKKFSTASFEFGQPVKVKGVYQKYPVPSLKVVTQPDVFGKTSSITMPLVGYGKFGAEGVIAELEKEYNTSLDKKEVTFKGTLLYSDGKTLLQIDKNDSPLMGIIPVVSLSSHTNIVKELGKVELAGEIIDPKCYFGVMKPGHGKPHRDCAIRCMAGGISPVFYVRNENGEGNYYLIVGSDGEKINDQLKDYVAEPVSIKARAVQYDDWVVLYLDKNQKIKRIGGLSWFKTDDASCGPSHDK